MEFMFFFVWIVIVITFVITILASTASKFKGRLKAPTIAHDGHVIPGENDITCEGAYGHNHAYAVSMGETPRYIVHEDPDDGYVVLNGVLRRIEDCKYL